jgi:hypothetical protein
VAVEGVVPSSLAMEVPLVCVCGGLIGGCHIEMVGLIGKYSIGEVGLIGCRYLLSSM